MWFKSRFGHFRVNFRKKYKKLPAKNLIIKNKNKLKFSSLKIGYNPLTTLFYTTIYLSL